MIGAVSTGHVFEQGLRMKVAMLIDLWDQDPILSTNPTTQVDGVGDTAGPSALEHHHQDPSADHNPDQPHESYLTPQQHHHNHHRNKTPSKNHKLYLTSQPRLQPSPQMISPVTAPTRTRTNNHRVPPVHQYQYQHHSCSQSSTSPSRDSEKDRDRHGTLSTQEVIWGKDSTSLDKMRWAGGLITENNYWSMWLRSGVWRLRSGVPVSRFLCGRSD